jgi:hypothetical protein
MQNKLFQASSMTSTPRTPELSELLDLLDQLTSESSRRWGSMTPAQMLRHGSSFISFTLGEKKASLPTRIVGKIFGPLIYAYVSQRNPWNFPKNLQTFPEIKQKPGRELDFELEKDQMAAALRRSMALEKAVKHPIYGKLAAHKAKELIQLHTAYHFRQFGLFN